MNAGKLFFYHRNSRNLENRINEQVIAKENRLLIKENFPFSNNENIQSILQFKIIIALRQLNSERKTLILMAL